MLSVAWHELRSRWDWLIMIYHAAMACSAVPRQLRLSPATMKARP